ncbi:DUF4302 domain-containing protein [Marinoscillum sp. MHG1-6]|uniref:DUF4302 domain-containing protein n=1 Tax=Marinoscillum sp. MHG1-6 TaxID=2959627 RepID=UPI0021580953|nr:DUF4302 domain-containing protein [Marinoscillum sp. MHG1-6]
MRRWLKYGTAGMALLLLLTGCNQDADNIGSVEERKAIAKTELKNKLIEASSGWRIDYKPTSEAGTFLIILNFYEDGTVRVQSDVPANDGEFYDDTITYRIDNDLGTELILETYGVFHYLFELNQNSFGAEFEFLYQGETAGNLVFSSKSDGTEDKTILVFRPAASTDAGLISKEIVAQLATGGYRLGDLAGIGANALYQMYYPDDNVSVFASFDLGNRRAKIHGAAIGYTFDEVKNASLKTEIQTVTDISFLSEQLIFDQPVNFTLSGKQYTINSFSTNNFQQLDTVYCMGQDDSYSTFDASFDGLGNGELVSSIYSNYSTFFESTDKLYQISPFFMYDAADSSLADTINNSFDNIIVFLMLYESFFNSYTGTEPFTGMGWVGLNPKTNDLEFYLREMNVLERSGNYVSFELTDGTYIDVADSLDERDALFALTDSIFAGGVIYGSEVLSFDELYEVYNPCNDYKFFLFE